MRETITWTTIPFVELALTSETGEGDMDDKRKIHPSELNSLLHMAVDRHGLDPANTYIEFTWWDNVFKPLTGFDCGMETGRSAGGSMEIRQKL